MADETFFGQWTINQGAAHFQLSFMQSQNGGRKCFRTAEGEMTLFAEEKRQQPKIYSKHCCCPICVISGVRRLRKICCRKLLKLWTCSTSPMMWLSHTKDGYTPRQPDEHLWHNLQTSRCNCYPLLLRANIWDGRHLKGLT